MQTLNFATGRLNPFSTLRLFFLLSLSLSQGQTPTQSGEGCVRGTRCTCTALALWRTVCALPSLNTATSSTSPWTTHASTEHSKTRACGEWGYCSFVLTIVTIVCNKRIKTAIHRSNCYIPCVLFVCLFCFRSSL